MRTRLIALSLGLLFLTGCGGCKTRPKEEQEETQRTQVPILVCEKDGIRLYKVRDTTEGGTSYVYFAVPVGSTYWMTTDHEGDTEHHRVVGPPTLPKKK
jgi:hypothetical protein